MDLGRDTTPYQPLQGSRSGESTSPASSFSSVLQSSTTKLPHVKASSTRRSSGCSSNSSNGSRNGGLDASSLNESPGCLLGNVEHPSIFGMSSESGGGGSGSKGTSTVGRGGERKKTVSFWVSRARLSVIQIIRGSTGT